MKKLIYVCYSNKGRSLALATYTRNFLKQFEVGNITVNSAGIGLENIDRLRERGIDHASQNTSRILLEEGFDVSSHRLKYFGDIVHGANLILATDELTFARTRAEFPHYKDRTFLARQFAGFERNLEIFGPYAESRKHRMGRKWSETEGYRDMLREVKVVSKRVASRIAREK